MEVKYTRTNVTMTLFVAAADRLHFAQVWCSYADAWVCGGGEVDLRRFVRDFLQK